MHSEFLNFALVFFTGMGTLLIWLKFFSKQDPIIGSRPLFMSVESKKSFDFVRRDIDAKQSKEKCQMEIKVINTILEPMKDDIKEIKDDMKKVLKVVNGDK